MKSARIERRNLIKSGEGRHAILLRTNTVLLIALSIFIFIVPAIPSRGLLLTRTLLSIIVISGLFAADFSKTAFRILATLGSLAIIFSILDLVFPESHALNIMAFLLNTLFFAIVSVALVAHIASAPEAFSSTILAAINSYLLIGLTLSILFQILDLVIPGSFEQIESAAGSLASFIYFGFVTLTTLGYGDISPDTPLARSLASFAATFGQLYLVIIMALIIGKYLRRKE
jgi:hypothetical protein